MTIDLRKLWKRAQAAIEVWKEFEEGALVEYPKLEKEQEEQMFGGGDSNSFNPNFVEGMKEVMKTMVDILKDLPRNKDVGEEMGKLADLNVFCCEKAFHSDRQEHDEYCEHNKV